MKQFILSFSSSLGSMVLLDAFWLMTMLPKFYSPQIGHLMGESPKIIPAIFFYFLFALGLTYLVVLPSVQNYSAFSHVFWLGLLFGLVSYGTYDLTNQATMKNWPVVVTIVDMIWGALLTGLVSLIAVFLTRRFS